MSAFLQANLPFILAGISVGGQYALIAIGYTMVYGILRLINFAHGDVFFSPVSTEAAAQIIAKADTQALGMPILAGDTWDSNVILQAAKGTNVRICVTTFYQEGADPDFDFGIKYWINSDATALANNGGNDELAAVTVMGYDAYYVALEALKAAGSTDPADVLEVLPSLNYTGVTGAIAFDDIGDALRDSAFVKECNTETGSWDFVTVATVG